MVVSVRPTVFVGMVHLVLSGLLLGAERIAEHWGTEPLGPKVEAAPFRPAPVTRELHPTLKVNTAGGTGIVLVRENQPSRKP